MPPHLALDRMFTQLQWNASVKSRKRFEHLSFLFFLHEGMEESGQL